MKKLIMLVLFLSTLNFLNAQIDNTLQSTLSINTSGTDADDSAILDVSSTSKGVVMPRMTSSQKGTLESIAIPGLMVYDTDLDLYCFWNGVLWICPNIECETLDEAYDCGGPGMGSTIMVTDGPVVLDGSSPAAGPTLRVTNADSGFAVEALSATSAAVYGESTFSDGVYGKSTALTSARAGVMGEGGGSSSSPAALEARNGAVTVSKTTSPHFPADVFATTVSAWTPFFTCTEEPDCADCMDHTHQHGRFSGPITITNVYADSDKSVIMLTIEGREGLSVELAGIGDGSFDIIVNDIAAALFCDNQSDALPVKIHYFIINKE